MALTCGLLKVAGVRVTLSNPFYAQLTVHCRSLSTSMPAFRKSECYVNGEWVKSQSGETFKVYNPANGKEIGEVADFSVEDTKLAIAAAQNAYGGWRRKTAKERSIHLSKWHKLIAENANEIGDILTEENGKPVGEARGEVAYAGSFVEFFAEEAKRVYGETIPAAPANKRAIIMREPIGVAGLIIPWNFPAAMLTRKAAAAMAVGCTVVVKTPEDTPYTPLALAELADRAGIPKGVLNVVSCSRKNVADIGKLFCGDPQVATISFTGSTEVGRRLMADCAPQVKRVSLELGGLAPLILFDSANLTKAIPDIKACKFRNSGQTCICAQNFFIQEGIYEQAMGPIIEMVKSLKMGDPSQPGTTIGPLINKRGLDKVVKLVEDAKAKGATVVVGGSRATDVGELYFQPTLLTDVTEDMDIYKEEVFGPVMAVMKFKTEEEALRLANASERGLASYFYTSDLSQTYRVMEGLEAGMVGCNETSITGAELPFGGYKQSGLGREGGKFGLEEFLETKLGVISLV